VPATPPPPKSKPRRAPPPPPRAAAPKAAPPSAEDLRAQVLGPAAATGLPLTLDGPISELATPPPAAPRPPAEQLPTVEDPHPPLGMPDPPKRGWPDFAIDFTELADRLKAPALFILALALVGLAAMGTVAVLDEPPEVTEPPPTLRGDVRVEVEPAGAEVLVDGVLQGRAPVTVPRLITGTHRFEVRAEGYATMRRDVLVREGGHSEAFVLFAQASPDSAATGRIHLASTPPGATVLLRGEALGVTPLRNLELPLGPVQLELRLADGRVRERAVLVVSDEVRPTHLDLTY
jgi:hypothetical protein